MTTINNFGRLENTFDKEEAVHTTQFHDSFKTRSVVTRVAANLQKDGDGAHVRRSIGNAQVRNFDPFLMLDEFVVQPPAGFPGHPHRGFETVTYMLPTTEGCFKHEDFKGHTGILKAGDVQWMTAGRGIVHSELPENDKLARGMQLWINLKAKDKMIAPAYQELAAKDIAKVEANGVKASVIAGTALGCTSKVYTRTPVYYSHFVLGPNSIVEQKIPTGWNAFLYTLEGTSFVGPSSNSTEPPTKCDAHFTIILSQNAQTGGAADGVRVVTGSEGAEFMLAAGEPIGEPVVQHGPFVMNSREEIMQTFRDYQQGINGFEGAHEWAGN